ncbi:hypothetical protein ACA910_007000 [Epithemia clementina (nom. ined.)]
MGPNTEPRPASSMPTITPLVSRMFVAVIGCATSAIVVATGSVVKIVVVAIAEGETSKSSVAQGGAIPSSCTAYDVVVVVDAAATGGRNLAFVNALDANAAISARRNLFQQSNKKVEKR